ncbi:MAG: imidazole glycerol phosphate synthase subunit HisH [Lachnospiraceae bacterium]|nr:imidazole glycerol phosphate synthase subunit HisH [Lachnospiraceae bacterium]
MVAIIDYDAGNIKSVEKAVQRLGQEAVVTRDADLLRRADHIILPGVGAFGDAMEKLKRYELIPVIRETIHNGIPFLAICLGLQLLFEESEESPGIPGLGIFKGSICRIPDTEGLKVPQIGWNSLHFPRESRLFRGCQEDVYVYFVHSYFLKAEDESIVSAETEYGVHIHAAVEKDNVFACQFHPEKSSEAGLHMLKNFLDIRRV